MINGEFIPKREMMLHTQTVPYREVRVAIIAVGTEVTDGQIQNSNGPRLAQYLTQLGLNIVCQLAVPDERNMILWGLNQAASISDLVFVTGGLGPTSDDFTREVIAKWAEVELEFREDAFAEVSQKLFSRGVTVRDGHRRQCHFPEGAKLWTNLRGTAQGFSIQKGSVELFALPGPPIELTSVWDQGLKKYLEPRIPAHERRHLWTLSTHGMGESEVAHLVELAVADVMGIDVGYRLRSPYVEVKFWVKASQSHTLVPIFEKLAISLGDHLVLKPARVQDNSRVAPDGGVLLEPSQEALQGGIEISAGVTVQPKDVIQVLTPHMTEERLSRIRKVVQGRTYKVIPVLEDIYDRGNVSAVMRSSEAFGFQEFHIIELQEKFRVANRVTQGADKWLDVHTWKSTKDCLQDLRARGYKILCTSLQGGRAVGEYMFDQPTALIFGNEKRGVSDEARALSDGSVFLPMQGFVQSFNISVAAAVLFHHIVNWRKTHLGSHGDLSEAQAERLMADFCLRSLDSGDQLLKEVLLSSRAQLGSKMDN